MTGLPLSPIVSTYRCSEEVKEVIPRHRPDMRRIEFSIAYCNIALLLCSHTWKSFESQQTRHPQESRRCCHTWWKIYVERKSNSGCLSPFNELTIVYLNMYLLPRLSPWRIVLLDFVEDLSIFGGNFTWKGERSHLSNPITVSWRRMDWI